jgi:hypothetical protein
MPGGRKKRARRKKEKAGKVEDMVYTDKKYDFKLTIDKGWKYKIMANKEYFRMVLTQKNYEIPPNYLDNSEYTQVPRLVVFADTADMDVLVFMDSLVSETFSSDQKKEILKEFEILNEQAVEEGTEREETVRKKRVTISIAGQKAVRWEGQTQYRKFIPSPSDPGRGERVYGAYGGGVVVVKKDNIIILFHVISEWDFFAPIMNEALGMIKSLQWVEQEKEEGKK